MIVYPTRATCSLYISSGTAPEEINQTGDDGVIGALNSLDSEEGEREETQNNFAKHFHRDRGNRGHVSKRRRSQTPVSDFQIHSGEIELSGEARFRQWLVRIV